MNNSGTVFPCQFHAAVDVTTNQKTPVIIRNCFSSFTAEYIVSGAGFLEINGESFHPEADSIYFLHIRSAHRYWPDKEDPWRKVFFQLSGPLVEELLTIYGLQNVYWIPQAKELRSYFESFLHLNMVSSRINECAAVLLHEFAEACAEHLSRIRTHIPDAVLALREELESSLNRRFSLADYCERKHLSSSYLIRAFRKSYGCTPLAYLLERRCETAKRMLRYSELSIKEIADSLNFTDQYHFSNFIRKRTGESPTAFRQV